MAIGSEQLDEASLKMRLAAQKQLVARLVSEGKDATEANTQLYELSKALAEIRHELRTNPTATGAPGTPRPHATP
jgi:hypothetical protein